MLLDSKSGSDGHQDTNVKGAHEDSNSDIREFFKITILFSVGDFTYESILKCYTLIFVYSTHIAKQLYI